MESRLTDLEIRITHQETALEEMGTTLTKQQKQIQALLADIATLQRQLRDLTPSNIAAPHEETPPPHY